MRPAAAAATLSGRADERATLLDAVRAGLDGSPRALLVHGEAGIGKTSLVRSVCAQVAGERTQVLWGQSLRFGTVEAMYHPLVLALEGWLGEADEAERASVIKAVPGATLILPSLGASHPDGPSALMMVVDALLSRVVARGPTVLVVDDVQWADPATWDALSYLVAGFGRQRLALVTTHRDEAAVSEQFQHWLGNVRRLPGTEELVLARLDQEATGDQIAELLGWRPPPRLVEQVYERSGGNPYFSELLVRRGDLDSSELPDDLPDELSQALLAAWRRMSRETREVTRVLAIAGRPTVLRTLTTTAAELAGSQAGSVREAVDAGVIVLGGDEVWFRHPLLAGVLAETYLPGEAAPVHEAWARHLESVSTDGVDELRRLGDLASHHERAGDGSAAFAALLKGAELAEGLSARREAADLLARAADLWETAADARDVVGRARLLERSGRTCLTVGRSHDGIRLLRSARDLVSPERHPLWASKLIAVVAQLAFVLGETRDFALAEFERAVELSSVEPDSRGHAEALASYARALFWAERHDEARRMVEDAVAAAERSGSAAAISMARGNRAEILAQTDLRRADRDATVCWEHAWASGDPHTISNAYGILLMISYASGNLRLYHEQARDMYEWSARQGLQVWPSVLTDALLAMGDLVGGAAIVRTGLAATGSAYSQATIRVYAGVLAARRGENDAARGHLTRAHEILPHIEEQPGAAAGAPIADLLLTQDDPAAAFELIERVLPLNTVDPRVLDDLTVLGARAAADLVQRASDDRDEAAVRRHQESLTRLVKTRATLPGIPFQPSGPDDTVQTARAALFAAETGRAEGVEDQVGLWREAVAACAAAALGWEQQLSSWRLASVLIESGASGTEGAELLQCGGRTRPLCRDPRGLAEIRSCHGADVGLGPDGLVSLSRPTCPSRCR